MAQASLCIRVIMPELLLFANMELVRATDKDPHLWSCQRAVHACLRDRNLRDA